MSIVNKIISVWFRIAFISLIVINYIYFIPHTWYPICKSIFSIKSAHPLGLIIVFIYNYLIFMLLWCIIITAKTDPGKVPIYWGFYFGDSDLKRKRYCLMCNVFKPERCHHCSICNRCVLNMDHHCPWINNCVGFYNRKFFMQMLFYLCLTLIFTNSVNAKFLFDIIKKVYTNRINFKREISETFGFLLIYFIDLVLNVVIVLFFKFHLIIILENKTTIETIDKKTTEFNSVFDIGSNKNWLQVMGNNKLLWFFPIKLSLGMPIGNGIDWFEKEEDNKKLHNMSLSSDLKDQSNSINTRNNNSQIINNANLINTDNRNSLAININTNNQPNSSLIINQPKIDEQINTNIDPKNNFSNDEKDKTSSKFKATMPEFPFNSKDKETNVYNAPLKMNK